MAAGGGKGQAGKITQGEERGSALRTWSGGAGSQSVGYVLCRAGGPEPRVRDNMWGNLKVPVPVWPWAFPGGAADVATHPTPPSWWQSTLTRRFVWWGLCLVEWGRGAG